MVTRCDTCRYWSEMIAESRPAGIVAMCLSGDGVRAGAYTYGAQACSKWADNDLGAVDEPPLFGKQYEEEAF